MGRGAWLLFVVALLVCPGRIEAAPGVPPGRFPDKDCPARFVAIRIPPGPAQKSFNSLFPVKVRELRPKTAKEVAGLAALTPAGYTWRFSRGFGQLIHDSDPAFPCRAFAVGLPPLDAPTLKMRVRSAGPRLFQEQNLQSKLDTLGIAVVGLQSTNLDTLFPVPFDAEPPNLSLHMGLGTVMTSYPKTVVLTTPYKIDGAVVALLRDLVWKDVVTVKDAWAALQKQPPYSSQSGQSQFYFFSFLKAEADDAFRDAATKFLAENPDKSSRPDIAKWPLFFGLAEGLFGDKTESARTLDLSKSTGKEGSSKPIIVKPFTPVRPDSAAEFDGFAVPTNGGNVFVLMSGLSMTSYPWTRATLAKQLLRGWRWLKILKEPDRPWTQTLLRFNEPIWDWICTATVSSRFGGAALDSSAPVPADFGPITSSYGAQDIDGLDPVDARILDEAVADDISRAAHSDLSYKLSGDDNLAGIRGQQGDGYYPARTMLDHRLCALIKRAFDGKGAVGRLKAFLHRVSARIAAAPPRKDLARDIAKLVADGFTRDAMTFDSQNDLSTTFKNIVSELGPVANDTTVTAAITPAKLEPDLVWLARAVTKPTTTLTGIETPDGPLSHLFMEFAGTRLDKGLTELTGSVTSVKWSQNGSSTTATTTPPPLLNKNWLLYFVEVPQTASSGSPTDRLWKALARLPPKALPEAVLSRDMRNAITKEQALEGKFPGTDWLTTLQDKIDVTPSRTTPTSNQTSPQTTQRSTTEDDIRTYTQEYYDQLRVAKVNSLKDKIQEGSPPSQAKFFLLVWADANHKNTGFKTVRGAPDSLENAMLEAASAAADEDAALAAFDQAPTSSTDTPLTKPDSNIGGAHEAADYYDKDVASLFAPGDLAVQAAWERYLVGSEKNLFTPNGASAPEGVAQPTLAELQAQLKAIATLVGMNVEFAPPK